MSGPSILYARNRRRSLFYLIVAVFLISLIAIICIGPSSVRGVEIFSNDAPFGKSYDDWVSEYWNWWIDAYPSDVNNDTLITKDEIPRCFVHESGSMVMLMQTALGETRDQICDISADKGIMVPLWSGWCDESVDLYQIDNPSVDLDKKLTDCARTNYNLGRIGSELKVDNVPVSNLNVIMSYPLGKISGELDYKINTLENVSEIYSKGFNLTIPEDTELSGKPGEWRAGSHGWWVFLEPLPPGKHTIYYNVRVQSIGALTTPGTIPTVADITYTMNVK